MRGFRVRSRFVHVASPTSSIRALSHGDASRQNRYGHRSGGAVTARKITQRAAAGQVAVDAEAVQSPLAPASASSTAAVHAKTVQSAAAVVDAEAARSVAAAAAAAATRESKTTRRNALVSSAWLGRFYGLGAAHKTPPRKTVAKKRMARQPHSAGLVMFICSAGPRGLCVREYFFLGPLCAPTTFSNHACLRSPSSSSSAQMENRQRPSLYFPNLRRHPSPLPPDKGGGEDREKVVRERSRKAKRRVAEGCVGQARRMRFRIGVGVAEGSVGGRAGWVEIDVGTAGKCNGSLGPRLDQEPAQVGERRAERVGCGVERERQHQRPPRSPRRCDRAPLRDETKHLDVH
jgi:hypothetical protein